MVDFDKIEFDRLAEERLAKGAIEYGPQAFEEDDMLLEAMNELVDFSNYAFLEWKKVKTLRERLRQVQS